MYSNIFTIFKNFLFISHFIISFYSPAFIFCNFIFYGKIDLWPMSYKVKVLAVKMLVAKMITRKETRTITVVSLLSPVIFDVG